MILETIAMSSARLRFVTRNLRGSTRDIYDTNRNIEKRLDMYKASHPVRLEQTPKARRMPRRKQHIGRR